MSLATQTGKGTAVITGASTGIGAVYASRLARMGYDLIIIARNHNRLNQMASHITADTARSVEVLAADLGDAQQLAAVEKKLRSDASITLLVNNAGVGTHTPLLSSDVDQMQAMINLNVVALTRLTYSVVLVLSREVWVPSPIFHRLSALRRNCLTACTAAQRPLFWPSVSHSIMNSLKRAFTFRPCCRERQQHRSGTTAVYPLNNSISQ